MPAPTPTDVFGPNFDFDAGANTFTFKYDGNAGGNGDMAVIVDDPVTAADDARMIVYAILRQVMKWYDATAVEARPEGLRIVSGGTLVNVGGVLSAKYNFSVFFKAEPGLLPLQDEP